MSKQKQRQQTRTGIRKEERYSLRKKGSKERKKGSFGNKRKRRERKFWEQSMTRRK